MNISEQMNITIMAYICNILQIGMDFQLPLRTLIDLAVTYFVSPNNNSFVNIVIEVLPRKNITLENYTDTGLKGLSKYVPSLDSRSIVNNSINIGNTTAQQIEFTIKDLLHNSYYKVMEVVLLKDNKAYIITYVSPQSEYDQDLPNIQTMVNSFKKIDPAIEQASSSILPSFMVIAILVIAGVFILVIFIVVVVVIIKKFRSRIK